MFLTSPLIEQAFTLRIRDRPPLRARSRLVGNQWAGSMDYSRMTGKPEVISSVDENRRCSRKSPVDDEHRMS